jgi:hypothetical protein
MSPIIVWFRQDLRLADNPALRAAAASGAPILPLFVLDDETPGNWRWGGASRWWLHHSLAGLNKSLRRHLVLRRGDAAKIIKALAKDTKAQGVVWNRCYEPFALERDRRLAEELGKAGVVAETFNAALLHEPWEVKNRSGKPFQVFTPFWKTMRGMDVDRPHAAPRRMRLAKANSERLESWKLLPRHPDWAKDFDWTPGEKAAHRALYDFLDDVKDYAHARDIPARHGTSRLSPHLHWGELSPRQIWHAVRTHGHGTGHETFLKELGWREFCIQLLFHHPQLPSEPLDKRFETFKMAAQRQRLSCLDQGPDGHSHRGCGHAPALADGLDAQSGAHDRGQLPDQTPWHPLATRRALVLGHVGGCGPGQQCRQLAMGGRLRRRCGPILPRLQSGAAGKKVRSGRCLCPPLCSGTEDGPGQTYPQPVGGASAARRLPRAHRGFGCGPRAGAQIFQSLEAVTFDL